MSHWNILKQLLSAFMRVEKANLQIKHRLACYAEQKMAGLDDSGMNRPDRHLKHTFAFDVAEFVPLAGKGSKPGLQVEIFSQGMNLRPIVVQRATAWVGMA